MLTPEQIHQNVKDLPEEAQNLLIEFIEILKKCYPQPTEKKSSEEISLYEKFDKNGLIGCVSTEENLSTTYKQVLAEGLNTKYDHR
ncbi:MAG: DUF2281 domain-containing protein [Crinalium sp.]